MNLLHEFVRVSRARACPVCARQKYCLIDRGSPDDPDRVICTKIESPKKWGEAGWLHVLKNQSWRTWRAPRQGTVAVKPAASDRFALLAARFAKAVVPERLEAMADRLGLTMASLRRLGVGWADGASLRALGTIRGGTGCWTFPMTDARGSVIGIRLRRDDGFKFAVTGSKQGLFVPTELKVFDHLFIAEGPTDTAALLDIKFGLNLSYDAVGRPSCEGGTRLLVALVKRLGPQDVYIVSDGDEPGMRGAASLERVLRLYAPRVCVIRPPKGLKDVREWKAAARTDAAFRSQMQVALQGALPRRPVIAVRGGR